MSYKISVHFLNKGSHNGQRVRISFHFLYNEYSTYNDITLKKSLYTLYYYYYYYYYYCHHHHHHRHHHHHHYYY